MNWIWNFDKDLFPQIPEFLNFITDSMEEPKKLWIKSQYAELGRYCAVDSPNEHVMLIQLLVCLHRHVHGGIVEIKPQAEIKLQDTVMRMDFLLATKVGDFAIECHGKTHLGEQVWKQDLKKARSLVGAGITYCAYASYEILFGAQQCLCGEEIRGFIDTRIARRVNWIRPEAVLDIIKKYLNENLGPMLIDYLKTKEGPF
jgi:hypothetical protein